MRLARALILLCSVLALSACGSATKQHAAETPRVVSKPPPAIEAIDEPAPDWASPSPYDEEGTASSTACIGDCDSPEVKEKLRKQEEEFSRATAPAKGSEPRAIAQLRLVDREPGSRALLIAWRTEAGRLCLADEEETDDSGSGSGPEGPCVPELPCTKICLKPSGSGTGSNTRYSLTGVVSSGADTLRMTLDDGRVVTYELSGPRVPGFPEYRVFMLDLGRDLYTRLELLQGEKVIMQQKLPLEVVRGMRCTEKHPVDDMPRSSAEAEKSPLAQCFEQARSK